MAERGHLGLPIIYYDRHVKSVKGANISVASHCDSDYCTSYDALSASIASSGTTDSILKASHLPRTRHAHQVSTTYSILKASHLARTRNAHQVSKVSTTDSILKASHLARTRHAHQVSKVSTTDSILKASHLARTRHAHQVSALALTPPQQDAFLGMLTEESHDGQTKYAWGQDMITKSPTFQYRDTLFNVENMGVIFVRPHRQILHSSMLPHPRLSYPVVLRP